MIDVATVIEERTVAFVDRAVKDARDAGASADEVSAIAASTRADAPGRLRTAARADVPRLRAELDAYKAQAAKSADKATLDPGKAESHAAVVAEGEAALALEQAVLAAVGGDLPPAASGVAAGAFDAGVAVKES